MVVIMKRNIHVRFVCSEIYPYVVITIGLENILIIVKAVMSTPEELDVSNACQTCAYNYSGSHR